MFPTARLWLLTTPFLLAPALARPLVIAHRGASGYLPEHTLEAAAYAHALGADYIEQDVVLTRDDVLIVSHDIHLDTTTDVATRFPSRHRPDGRYYAVDFTWEDVRSLEVHERIDLASGSRVFPGRFPSHPDDGAAFRLCTLEEQIALIAGLNASAGRRVGLYPEIKAPGWHREQGRDPSVALLMALHRHGYRTAADPVFVQCFDPAELRRLRADLGCSLRLVQLLGDANDADVDYDAMRTPAGLREVATYAQGIGPRLSDVVIIDASGQGRVAPLVRDAHAAGLQVHPYTFRADALPTGVMEADALLRGLLIDARVDGLFIDQPDLAVRFLRAVAMPPTR